MPRNNTYHYDVKNCHFFPGTRNADGSITYAAGAGIPIPGLRSMNLGSEGDTTRIRADGIDYIVISGNNGYSGTLNFVQIPDEFREKCLSEVVDATTGIQYEDANADPKPFALVGEFKGDVKNIRWIFYNCVAARPAVAGDNKDNMKEPDTEELSLTVSPVPHTVNSKEVNLVRAGITEGANNVTYNHWFDQVVLPGVAVQAS